MMNNSIQALSGVLNSFTRAAGAAERVLSVIDLKPDIDPDDGAPVDLAVQTWDLRLDGVTFYYQMRPTNPVLQGLSFAVPEGTVCALVGTSGGGKSTVIHLLLRYYDPIDGVILLGGVEFKDLNFPSVHRRIGVVSQDTQMFNCSIGENITCERWPGTTASLRARAQAQARARSSCPQLPLRSSSGVNPIPNPLFAFVCAAHRRRPSRRKRGRNRDRRSGRAGVDLCQRLRGWDAHQGG